MCLLWHLTGIASEALAQITLFSWYHSILGHVSFPLRRQVPLLLNLINFREAQRYWIGFTPKDRMDFKGQQHSDAMSFFKLTADFQKNFLQFVKEIQLYFLKEWRLRKLNCISPPNWIKKEYLIMGMCSLLLTYVATLLRALSLAGGWNGSPGIPPPCSGHSKVHKNIQMPE